MKLFPTGHATHPQWRMAAALVLAQLRAQMALPDYAWAPTLGLLYITDHYANEAQALLDYLSGELPEVTDWSGTVGVGVSANNAEYFDEPALSVMLLDVPADQYRVFSGVAPLPAHAPHAGTGFVAHTALIVKLCLHLPNFTTHRRHAMRQSPTAAVQLHAHLFYGFIQRKLAFQAACHTLLPCTSDLRPQHSRQ